MNPAPLAPLADRAQAPAQLGVPRAGGLTWRPVRPEQDLDGLHALVATIEAADDVPSRTSRAEVADELGAPWLDLARDTLVGLDADGVPRAWGIVDHRPGGERTVRAYLAGGVHPDLRGRGTGRELLAWQTGRARQVLGASDARLPGRIMAAVDEAEPPGHARLLEAAGYAVVRYFAVLRRDLTAPVPQVELGEGLRMVPFGPERDEATRQAHNAAFRDHWGSEPHTEETWARGRENLVPEWSFLVVAGEGADERVVGYQLAERFEEDWPVVGYTFGYTGILGVVREHRGRGIAVALLARAMQAFKDAGLEYAALDVDTANPSGADRLYARLGYETRHTSATYAIEL